MSIKNEIAKTAAHAHRLLAISGCSPLPKSHLTSQNERKVIINHAQIAVTAMKHTILTAMFKLLNAFIVFSEQISGVYEKRGAKS